MGEEKDMKTKEYIIRIPADREESFFDAMQALGFVQVIEPDMEPTPYQQYEVIERIYQAQEGTLLDWDDVQHELD